MVNVYVSPKKTHSKILILIYLSMYSYNRAESCLHIQDWKKDSFIVFPFLVRFPFYV